MGPAQSARRIQPGELRSAGAGFGGSSPPSPLRPPGTRPRGRAGGGGPARGPPPGRRPALAGRISSAAVRRDRLRVGWEGLRRAGGPAPRERRRVLQPPGSRSRRIPGPRERTAAAPSSPPVGGAVAGGVAASPPGEGRRPRSAAFRAGVRGPGPPAPGAAVNRGGLSSVRPDRAAPPGRASRAALGRPGSAAMSATHPTRLETRTKESSTCASQGPLSKARGAMKVRAGARRLRWDPGARVAPGSPGRTTGPSRPPPPRGAGEVERERPC